MTKRRAGPGRGSYLVALVALVLLAVAGPSPAANPVKGGATYRLHCSMCHGENGRRVMPSAPDFSRGEGTFQPDMALLEHIEAGKRACPSYRGILQQQDILDLISYIRTLHR